MPSVVSLLEEVALAADLLLQLLDLIDDAAPLEWTAGPQSLLAVRRHLGQPIHHEPWAEEQLLAILTLQEALLASKEFSCLWVFCVANRQPELSLEKVLRSAASVLAAGTHACTAPLLDNTPPVSDGPPNTNTPAGDRKRSPVEGSRKKSARSRLVSLMSFAPAGPTPLAAPLLSHRCPTRQFSQELAESVSVASYVLTASLLPAVMWAFVSFAIHQDPFAVGGRHPLPTLHSTMLDLLEIFLTTAPEAPAHHFLIGRKSASGNATGPLAPGPTKNADRSTSALVERCGTGKLLLDNGGVNKTADAIASEGPAVAVVAQKLKLPPPCPYSPREKLSPELELKLSRLLDALSDADIAECVPRESAVAALNAQQASFAHFSDRSRPLHLPPEGELEILKIGGGVLPVARAASVTCRRGLLACARPTLATEPPMRLSDWTPALLPWLCLRLICGLADLVVELFGPVSEDSVNRREVMSSEARLPWSCLHAVTISQLLADAMMADKFASLEQQFLEKGDVGPRATRLAADEQLVIHCALLVHGVESVARKVGGPVLRSVRRARLLAASSADDSFSVPDEAASVQTPILRLRAGLAEFESFEACCTALSEALLKCLDSEAQSASLQMYKKKAGCQLQPRASLFLASHTELRRKR